MFSTQRSTAEINTRADLVHCFYALFTPVWALRENGFSALLHGQPIPQYGPRTSGLETFSRLLWGVFPALANDRDNANHEAIFRQIAHGTDPAHPDYWGEAQDIDQRCVEMPIFGIGLALAGESFRHYLTPMELQNLFRWLKGIREVRLPENNWSFFPIMVEMGLCLSGQPWSQSTVERYFARLDSFWLGDGWYSDGLNRPRDYYNAMALHFYGLIYARLMRDVDPERCALLRQRASGFAADFIHFFAADGAAIPFGRSMTYRFAQAAFWSAAAFAGLDGIPPGVIKGLILRHLRGWLKQPIFDPCGALSVGYGYANIALAEDYNAPGSPLWACKLFLILALDEQHSFWQCDELPLPTRAVCRAIPHAGQLAIDDPNDGHHYLLNAGQLPAKNYANSESKYCKFAYSSLLGFNIERSRYGIELSACDSMLLLAESDGYFRGRRESTLLRLDENAVATLWTPWPDVRIQTWLVPLSAGHLRLHIIDTARTLDSVEGGFPIPHSDTEPGYFSTIRDISAGSSREHSLIVAPPASNIIFPESSAVPVLTQRLAPGRHILCCVVNAGTREISDSLILPHLMVDKRKIQINHDRHTLDIPL